MFNVSLVLLGLLLIALNVADWKLTSKILSQGGKEVNPVMIWLMGKLGVEKALIAKVIFVVFMSLGAIVVGIINSAVICLLALLCLDTLYGWVVYHNIKQLKK
jgi:hypothetical protein